MNTIHSAFFATRRSLALGLLALGCSLGAIAQTQAPVQVDAPWVRVSVPGQKTSGAFMRLTAREPLSLVGAVSPVAGAVEVHEMKMDGEVMRMRAVPSLPLPAGQAVELGPGGYHLMLLDLKAPLQAGTKVPLTLLLRDAQGKEQRLALELPVSARAPGNAPAPAHGHKH